jgi:hypothetical protein
MRVIFYAKKVSHIALYNVEVSEKRHTREPKTMQRNTVYSKLNEDFEQILNTAFVKTGAF